jgi:hypothetical protein
MEDDLEINVKKTKQAIYSLFIKKVKIPFRQKLRTILSSPMLKPNDRMEFVPLYKITLPAENHWAHILLENTERACLKTGL